MVGAGCGDTDCGQLDDEGRVENKLDESQRPTSVGTEGSVPFPASDILIV